MHFHRGGPARCLKFGELTLLGDEFTQLDLGAQGRGGEIGWRLARLLEPAVVFHAFSCREPFVASIIPPRTGAAWRHCLKLPQTHLIVPFMFSIIWVHASDRLSSFGRHGRVTVRISSSPSRMLAATSGAPEHPLPNQGCHVCSIKSGQRRSQKQSAKPIHQINGPVGRTQ